MLTRRSLGIAAAAWRPVAAAAAATAASAAALAPLLAGRPLPLTGAVLKPQEDRLI